MFTVQYTEYSTQYIYSFINDKSSIHFRLLYFLGVQSAVRLRPQVYRVELRNETSETADCSITYSFYYFVYVYMYTRSILNISTLLYWISGDSIADNEA